MKVTIPNKVIQSKIKEAKNWIDPSDKTLAKHVIEQAVSMKRNYVENIAQTIAEVIVSKEVLLRNTIHRKSRVGDKS